MDEAYWRAKIERLENEVKELTHALSHMKSNLESVFYTIDGAYDNVKNITGFEFVLKKP